MSNVRSSSVYNDPRLRYGYYCETCGQVLWLLSLFPLSSSSSGWTQRMTMRELGSATSRPENTTRTPALAGSVYCTSATLSATPDASRRRTLAHNSSSSVPCQILKTSALSLGALGDSQPHVYSTSTLIWYDPARWTRIPLSTIAKCAALGGSGGANRSQMNEPDDYTALSAFAVGVHERAHSWRQQLVVTDSHYGTQWRRAEWNWSGNWHG